MQVSPSKHLWRRSLARSETVAIAVMLPISILLFAAIVIFVLMKRRSSGRLSVDPASEAYIDETDLIKSKRRTRPNMKLPPLFIHLGQLPSECPPTAREIPVLDICPTLTSDTLSENDNTPQPEYRESFSRASGFSIFSLHIARLRSSVTSSISKPPPVHLQSKERGCRTNNLFPPPSKKNPEDLKNPARSPIRFAKHWGSGQGMYLQPMPRTCDFAGPLPWQSKSRQGSTTVTINSAQPFKGNPSHESAASSSATETITDV